MLVKSFRGFVGLHLEIVEWLNASFRVHEKICFTHSAVFVIIQSRMSYASSLGPPYWISTRESNANIFLK